MGLRKKERIYVTGYHHYLHGDTALLELINVQGCVVNVGDVLKEKGTRDEVIRGRTWLVKSRDVLDSTKCQVQLLLISAHPVRNSSDHITPLTFIQHIDLR